MMPKRKPINCITPRTDAEWPPDHPLRKYTTDGVMTNEALKKFNVEQIALVCAKPGDERLPCPPDDHDVACACFRCGCDLLRRASANPEWQAVCFRCWEAMQ